ncbi:unnamed protein product [Arabidopsis thaliana]|uniref:Uncharacterized protein n=1 Tax=Arabidopsis thaliana TaxID=3702 RepID=A0A654E8Z5_ARATH|nr:unnamed protein product [Arabidopsis thaliana]VYS45355.1 unnamed protein product [Arabidopsis thaliana]
MNLRSKSSRIFYETRPTLQGPKKKRIVGGIGHYPSHRKGKTMKPWD